MNGRKPTPREHLLILAALAVFIGLGYALFRYIPASKETRELIRETEKLEAKRKEIQLPNDPSEELRQLEKEKGEMERTLAAERERLAALERTFAPVDALEIVHGLQVEISDLARASGLRIIENAPYAPNAPAASRSGALLPADRLGDRLGREARLFLQSDGPLFRRPLRRVRVAASYDGLRRFLEGLNRLSKRVTVVQYTIETARRGEAALVVTFILAL